MKPVIAFISIVVSLVSTGCDSERESELEELITELKRSEQALEARILEKDDELKELASQKRQAELKLEKVKSTIVEEVRDRLTAIESDYSAAIAYDAEIEEGIKVLNEAELKFYSKANEAAQKNQEFMEFIRTTDPIWAFTSGEDWGSGLAEALAELQVRNAALKAELEALRDKQPQKKPTGDGTDQPATAVESKSD